MGNAETKKVWAGIRRRAGKRLCKKWHDFDSFLADVGPRPSIHHTLRLIEPVKGYEPGNCRWELRSVPRLVDPRAKFMVRGMFDWDKWRAAGSPEL